MADDGDNLTEIKVSATMVPAAQWQAFKGGGDEAALDSIREQVATPDQDAEANSQKPTIICP
jgi:hypothetical protein